MLCAIIFATCKPSLFRFCGHGKVHPSITAAGYVLVLEYAEAFFVCLFV